MTKDEIKRIRIAASDITNFWDCYQDCGLHGDREGYVDAETLLAWLIENPHMAEIALQIKQNHG